MKQIYNLDSTESFTESLIINGNPSGIINFNRTNFQWALNTYRLMESNQWFPEEVGLAQDKTPYANLTDSERYMYDMVVSQLISNDSIQTNQLMDSINRYITSPVVNACLCLQAYQEANHSRSYAVAVEEVCEDTDKIYEMYKHEPALLRKNNAVANMYTSIYAGENPSAQDLLVAFSANQILEELVFPGGFVALWSLGRKLPGTAKLIQFIERDEDAHVAIFRNIFGTAKAQVGLDTKTEATILSMICDMCEEEKIWTKHITKDNLGFSDHAVNMFIEYQANAVCNNLKLPLQYKLTDGGPLMSIYQQYTLTGPTKKKANQFEVPVADYAINSIDEDY